MKAQMTIVGLFFALGTFNQALASDIKKEFEARLTGLKTFGSYSCAVKRDDRETETFKEVRLSYSHLPSKSSILPRQPILTFKFSESNAFEFKFSDINARDIKKVETASSVEYSHGAPMLHEFNILRLIESSRSTKPKIEALILDKNNLKKIAIHCR